MTRALLDESWLAEQRDNAERSDARVREAIEATARGEFVLVTDASDRENECDLIMAADAATPERIAFLVRHTSGVVCVPITGERLDELGIPLMVASGSDPFTTAFTQTVDYRPTTTTGISASDRAATIRALATPTAGGQDFCRPGHVFPLRSRDRGVLDRAGHTEAAVDLARLAGRYPAGVIAELVTEDGSMLRPVDCARFAAQHDLVVVSIADLVSYRQRHETLVELVADTTLPTRWGRFRCRLYQSRIVGSETVALTVGDLQGLTSPLVRIHSECLTSDVFGSLRCDCGDQLSHSLKAISAEGRGVLLYMRGHEGRGIGLGNKLRAYGLQDLGHDTVDANSELGLPVDAREYYLGAQVLGALGITAARLLTNNPAKAIGLIDAGIRVTERIPLHTVVHRESVAYMQSKRTRMGHLIPALDDQLHAAIL